MNGPDFGTSLAVRNSSRPHTVRLPESRLGSQPRCRTELIRICLSRPACRMQVAPRGSQLLRTLPNPACGETRRLPRPGIEWPKERRVPWILAGHLGLSRPTILAMTRCSSMPTQGLRADYRKPEMAVVLSAKVGLLVANHSVAAGLGETSYVKIGSHRSRSTSGAPGTRSSRRQFVQQGRLTTKLGRASRAAIVSRREHFAGQIPLQLNAPSNGQRNARLSSREA